MSLSPGDLEAKQVVSGQRQEEVIRERNDEEANGRIERSRHRGRPSHMDEPGMKVAKALSGSPEPDRIQSHPFSPSSVSPDPSWLLSCIM